MADKETKTAKSVATKADAEKKTAEKTANAKAETKPKATKAEAKEETEKSKTSKTKAGASTGTKITARSQKEQVKAKARLKEGQKNPINYYFDASVNKGRRVEFVEIKQSLNDKFVGKIDQDQFFAVSERSRRVFDLNKLLLQQAIETAMLYERVNFAVRVSAKWFESETNSQKIDDIISEFGENIMLILDATSLFANEESTVLNKLKRYRENFRLKVMIDNIENQNLSLTAAAAADIVRINAEYFDLKEERYSALMKFYRNYCREMNIKLAVKNVKEAKEQTFFFNYGADFVEGSAVYTPKKSLNTILRDFNID